MRRASIDRINSKYTGASQVSPAGFAVRASAVRNVSPTTPFYASSYTPPSAIISNGAIGTTGVIGGRTIATGGQAFGSHLAPVVTQNTIIRNSRIGVSGIRGSFVNTPPVYGVVQNPPVYEVVTTPPKVYEIVTPIIQVTPDTVVQHQAHENERSGRHLIQKRSSKCPWWCWLLLCLLLTLLLLGLLGWLFGGSLFGGATDKSQQQNKSKTGENGNTGVVVPVGRNNQNENENKTGSEQQQKQQYDEHRKLYCKTGILKNGKCLSCPGGSFWNGKSCLKKITQTKVINETENVNPSSQSSGQQTGKTEQVTGQKSNQTTEQQGKGSQQKQPNPHNEDTQSKEGEGENAQPKQGGEDNENVQSKQQGQGQNSQSKQGEQNEVANESEQSKQSGQVQGAQPKQGGQNQGDSNVVQGQEPSGHKHHKVKSHLFSE